MASAYDHDWPVSTGVHLPSLPATAGQGDEWENPLSAVVRPRLRVQILEPTALIRFEDHGLLLDEAILLELDQQLERLNPSHGHVQLVLNFNGVRYLSSEVLGKLARLAKQAEAANGRIRLCGMDPLVLEVLRITRLDGMFEICGDEAEALGLLVR